MPRERERERRKPSRKESTVSRRKSDQRHRLREKTSRALEKMTAQNYDDDDDWRTDQDDLRTRKKQFKPCFSSIGEEVKLKYWCRVIAYVEIVIGFIRLCIAFGFFSVGAQTELFKAKFPVIEFLETVGYLLCIISGILLFIGVSCMLRGPCLGHCVFSIFYILLILTTFVLLVAYGRSEDLQSQNLQASAIFWLHGFLPLTLATFQAYFAWCSYVLSNHIDFGDRMEEVEKHNRLKLLVPKASRVKEMSKIDLLLAA